MKKQFIFLSFLLAPSSLWGMEKKDAIEFMQKLRKQPLVQDARFFMLFHEYALQYFATDQTRDVRLAILEWLKKWLPNIYMELTDDALNNINYFINYPEPTAILLNNIDAAKNFFVIIYRAYLKMHPKKLCQVLLVYFDMNLIKNPYYRYFLGALVHLLGMYVESLKIDIPAKKEWILFISKAGQYIEKYESSSNDEKEFSRYYEGIEKICKLLKQDFDLLENKTLREQEALFLEENQAFEGEPLAGAPIPEPAERSDEPSVFISHSSVDLPNQSFESVAEVGLTKELPKKTKLESQEDPWWWPIEMWIRSLYQTLKDVIATIFNW